jgi:prophage regulatory protein
VNNKTIEMRASRSPLIAETAGDAIVQRFSEMVLRKGTVSAISGLPSSTLYRKVAAGEFPAPIKLGESASGWLLSEVEAWIATRREERDAVQREELLRRARASEGGA